MNSHETVETIKTCLINLFFIIRETLRERLATVVFDPVLDS